MMSEFETSWDASSFCEAAEARMNYFIVRAKYYEDFPKDKESVVSMLEDLLADIQDIKRSLRREP